MFSKNLSAIMRPVDWKYSTNRAILLITVLVMAGGMLWRVSLGSGLSDALGWGASAGFAVFLGWALARELDTDHEMSAFLAAGVALAGILTGGPHSGLLVMFWLIVALRILNRCVGLEVSWIDRLLFLSPALWLTWQGYTEIGILTAMAYFLDGRLSGHSRPSSLFTWGALILTGVIVWWHPVAMPIAFAALSWLEITGLVLAVALFTIVIYRSTQPRAVSDVGNTVLRGVRVQTAQVFGLATAAVFAGRYGAAGLALALPLWAALLGTGVYGLFEVVFRSRNGGQA